jgi:hypothetical protein
MKSNRWIEIIGALALIGAGLIFLVQNLGFVPYLSSLVWAGLFLLGGLLFLLGFALGRSHWWPLIPGSALVGIGLSILLDEAFAGLSRLGGELAGMAIFLCLAAGFAGVFLYDRRENWWALIPTAATGILAVVVLASALGSGELGGVILFLGLGLAFVAVYFVEIDGQRHNWWALIPAGALLSLAAVVLLSTLGAGGAAGAALFLGLGLTFGALYLMRGPERPLGWAWIPAVALLGFGAFVLLVTGELPYARLFWPLALIVSGVVLFLVNLRAERRRLE